MMWWHYLITAYLCVGIFILPSTPMAGISPRRRAVRAVLVLFGWGLFGVFALWDIWQEGRDHE
jgi:hypothetical protein